MLQTVIQIYFKQLLGDLSTRTFQEAHRATSQRWLLHQWPKQEEEENTLPGLQGMVITVYQSLTLTSAHSRLRLQSGGALQGKGLCLLLIWPLQYSLFFGGFFPPLYPALVSLWHSQRGKHDSSSSARHTAVRLGFFFFTLSSIATARLTENMYKFCSILGRCNYKVSFLIANSVCHLIVKCFKTKTDRPGQKPKGSSPLS